MAWSQPSRHWVLAVPAIPAAKQMVQSTARSQAGTGAGHRSPRLCIQLRFTWERGAVVGSHYVPVSELDAVPARLNPDRLVETQGSAATLGTLCFHGENPSLVCWLSPVLSLGQSRGSGREGEW